MSSEDEQEPSNEVSDAGVGPRAERSPAEFSRPVAVDRLAARGGETAVAVRAAAPAELALIARRLRIPAVASLAVDWTLRPVPGGAIEAEGALSARVVQECVVTLDPFEATVAERFRVLFVPDGEPAADGFDDDPDAPDTIPFDGRSIDLGEASVEQLALALPAFPRKPGVAFEAAADESEESRSPFGDLAGRLARRDG